MRAKHRWIALGHIRRRRWADPRFVRRVAEHESARGPRSPQVNSHVTRSSITSLSGPRKPFAGPTDTESLVSETTSRRASRDGENWPRSASAAVWRRRTTPTAKIAATWRRRSSGVSSPPRWAGRVGMHRHLYQGARESDVHHVLPWVIYAVADPPCAQKEINWIPNESGREARDGEKGGARELVNEVMDSR